MKTLNKVSTWLPGFTGFYGSLWEDGEDIEIENINDIRKEKGLSPIGYDDCEWDYPTYYKELSEKITNIVGGYLKEAGMINAWEFEKLSSPKEYNFVNDSIYVTFILDIENKGAINKYLYRHKEAFQEYITETYSSRSGFISSYSNDATDWLTCDYLAHEHKLGAVLNFILLDLLKEEGEDSIDMWINAKIPDNNGPMASNYAILTEGK